MCSSSDDHGGPSLSLQKFPHKEEGGEAEHAKYLTKALRSFRDGCPQTMYCKAVWAGAQNLCPGGGDLYRGLSVAVQGGWFLWLTFGLAVKEIPETK